MTPRELVNDITLSLINGQIKQATEQYQELYVLLNDRSLLQVVMNLHDEWNYTIEDAYVLASKIPPII